MRNGVQIHADAIATILTGAFLKPDSFWITVASTLLLSVLCGLAVLSWRPVYASLSLILLLVAYFLVVFALFDKGIILNILYPPQAILGTFVVLRNTKLHQLVLQGYKDTIGALAAAVDAKDPYTCGHSRRVKEYALRAGKSLRLSKRELEILEYASLLHDVGKIGIADALLSKPAILTEDEYRIVSSHSLIGANIIRDIPFLSEARELVLHHHEKYDGTGYPDGLKGEEISVGAAVLALADAFDAMTTKRAYRDALEFDDALRELRRCSGTQFSPFAVDAFVSSFDLGPRKRGATRSNTRDLWRKMNIHFMAHGRGS